ncbi:hypothetical protein FRC10_010096 [Ceratobasidium sp. 414]|nr:hypothetical protein FRC10_010096 [Ceratobasidium sp. 414]
MFNSQAIRAERQTRRVKQEAIDDSWLLLLQDVPSADFSYPVAPFNSLEAIPVAPLPIANAIPPTNAPQPVKKEEDLEAQQLLGHRWEFCKTLLCGIWDAIPAVPSLKSRSKWAKAHGVLPTYVHTWFNKHKQARGKRGIKVHPDDGYELQIEQPREPLPSSSDSEPGLGIWSTPLASSSLPPSSLPQTPVLFDSSMDFRMPEPLLAGWSPILPSIAPRPPAKVQTTPLFPTSAFEISLGYKEVQPRGATENAHVAPAPKAKRGRKRKIITDGEIPVPEPAKAMTKSGPKGKRPKVETKSAVNAPLVTATGDTGMSKGAGEGSSSFNPKAPTSHTVPPHSFAAETYTAILLAPFVLETAQENASNPPNASSSNSLAPVKEPLLAAPSPYITQPLPPLPAFEVLDDPGAFLKDCKDAFRTSLEMNFGLGPWGLVAEALPPSYFKDLGKDLDIEWPEVDWP